jgi:hypothetical protein
MSADSSTGTVAEKNGTPAVEPASDTYESADEPDAEYRAFTATEQTKVAPAADTTTTAAKQNETNGQAELTDTGNVIQVTRRSASGTTIEEVPADPAAVDTTEEIPEVSPERQTQITEYTAGLGADAVMPIDEGMKVDAALQGDSALGELTTQEQQYLVNSALDRWVPADPTGDLPTNYASINAVATGTAKDNPETSTVVSDAYASRAILLAATAEEGPPGAIQRKQAGSLGAAAVDAANTPEGQRALLDRLGTSGSMQLASALTREMDQPAIIQGGFYGDPASPDARGAAVNELLQATTVSPPSDASNAFVNQTFATLPENAYRPGGFLNDPATGDTSRSMALALAHQTHSADVGAEQKEAQRIEGILRTEQGRDYLTSDKLSTQQRVDNLAQLRGHENWDQAFLQQTRDVWENKEIAEANAKTRIEAFATIRGDAPQELAGTDLDNLIGASMNLPPAGIPDNETPEQRQAREDAVARGEHNLFASGEQQRLVQPVTDAIRSIGGDKPQVTVVPFQFASAETGPLSMNLYRVVDPATGGEKFVDNRGWTYDSFQDWEQTNTLPPGTVTYPTGGHLSPDGAVQTEGTPASSLGSRVAATIDDVAFTGALVAGGAIALGTGGLAAPLVLAGATAWGAARTIGEINDRANHQVSIGLDNPEARGLWLNLAGSAFGAGAATAGLAARGLTALGSTQARNAALAASALNGGAFIADSVAAANTGHQLITQWDNLSSQERASMALQIGFWGVGAGANVRMFSGNQRVSAALAEGLPQRGPMAFQAPDGFNPPLARNADGSYVDRFGNAWRPDPSTPGNWEVTPTNRAENPLGKPDTGATYVPVRADGTRIGQPSPEVLEVVNNHMLLPAYMPKRSKQDPIRGGHFEPDFRSFLYGDPANGIRAEGVIQSQRGTGVPGQSVIEYRLYQANPDQSLDTTLQSRVGTKTVWDPAIWTPERVARHVQEVLDTRPMTIPNYSGTWNINYQGVNYTARYTDGELKTFYAQ